MRKAAFYTALFVVGLVLQFGGLRFLAPFGIAPNLLLVFVLFTGLARGPVAGQVIGFAWGVAWDTLSVGIFGSHAFVLTVVGFTAGLLSHKWNESKALSQVLLTGVASLVYLLSMKVLYLVFGSGGMRFPVNYIALIQPLYNMLVTPPVFILGNLLLGYVRTPHEDY